MLPLLLKISGGFLIGLSLLHATFPKRFDWSTELGQLSLINRQIFQVHCFFIALTVGLMGVLCFGFTDTLLAPSGLGSVVAAGLTVFWACRLFAQFFVYDSALWRGHRFNTVIHILFSILWTFFTGVFAWTWAWQCKH
ncbi:hypothetical protein ACXR0O_13385 [Verrucomicrobiota bacterium sgz303538]